MEQEPGPEAEVDLGGEIAAKLRPLGEESGFDQETCDEIAQMSFFDAFETAYSYLTQAGLDADEILAEFVQEPET